MRNIFALILVSLFSIKGFAQTCEQTNTQTLITLSNGCGSYNCGPGQSTYGVFSVYGTVNNVGEPVVNYSCELRNCSTNIGYLYSDGALPYCGAASGVAGSPSKPNPAPNCIPGSIVQPENQILGESVPVVGADFSMNYFTRWQVGHEIDYKVTVPIADSTPRDDISDFDVLVSLGGSTLTSTSYVNNTSNVTFEYTWDGKVSGSPVLGSREVSVVVTEYRTGITVPVTTKLMVGNMQAKKIGLGGWLPSIYRFYDSNKKALFSGDGSERSVEAKPWNTTGYWVPERDGSVVYYFDSTGRIVQIKTGLVGTTTFAFNYDGQGRLTSIVQPFSRTTTFDRDMSGDLISITSPKGHVTVVTLDSNGYIESFENPNSETYAMTYYGTKGMLHTFTKPGAQVSTFTYDSAGNLTQDSHSGGYFFDLVSSLNGGRHTITTPLGRVTHYDANSTSLSTNTTIKKPNGIDDTYYFSEDGAGNILETQGQFGGTVTQTFWGDSRFQNFSSFLRSIYVNEYYGGNYYITNTPSVTLNDPDDPFSITAMSIDSQKSGGGLSSDVNTVYDPSTKIFSSTTGEGRKSEVKIDAYERPIEITKGNLYPTVLTYTNQDLTKVEQNGRETNLSYSSTTGFLSSISNPLSQSTAFVYDSAGRVSSKILPDLRTVTFSYDGNGNVTGITPPGRSIHVFGYNSSELVGSYEPPTLSGVSVVNSTYTYNSDKQLTQITKPTGDTVAFTYGSSTGFLDAITTPIKSYSISMDYVSGLPSSIAGSDGITTGLSYRGANLRGSSIYISSSYVGEYASTVNALGNMTQDQVLISGSDSTIAYTHDDDELLTGAGDLTLTNDTPNGMLTATSIGTSPNIVTDAYTYNSFGEVTGYQAKYGTTVIYDLTLGRDGMGRINSKTQIMNSTTDAYSYSFDTTGRLTQTDKNSATVATYGYDDNSNRNSGTIGLQATTATYDAQDRMTAYNLLTFTYNANGDLTSRTNTMTSTTTSYTYDVFGNLTSVTLPSTTVIDYEIDGLNRRIGKKINGVLQKRWVYMDQTRIAAELDSSGNIDKRFVYASKSNIPDYMIMGGNNYRIISDHLGSPRLVVKVSDGTIAGRMDHDEYGRVTVNTIGGLLPFGFAGGLYDADTGLVRFGARDYDSETGRWTSKDPILFGGGDTNLFGYVMQDPVNWIDPLGLRGARPIQLIPSWSTPWNPQPVGPPADQGPLDPIDFCSWSQWYCPSPPFGRVPRPTPKPTPVPPIQCLVNPSKCKVPLPDLRDPNTCPVN